MWLLVSKFLQQSKEPVREVKSGKENKRPTTTAKNQ